MSSGVCDQLFYFIYLFLGGGESWDPWGDSPAPLNPGWGGLDCPQAINI